MSLTPPSDEGDMVELSKDTKTVASGGRGGLLILLSYQEDILHSMGEASMKERRQLVNVIRVPRRDPGPAPT